MEMPIFFALIKFYLRRDASYLARSLLVELKFLKINYRKFHINISKDFHDLVSIRLISFHCLKEKAIT